MKFLPVLSYKLLLILFALAFVQGGPSSEARSAIRGAVMTRGPDNEPVFLPGVRILLRCEKAAGNQQATVTDEEGRFALSDLPPDKCSVTASAEGFRSETKIAAPTEGSVVELSFRLELLTVGERGEKP